MIRRVDPSPGAARGPGAGAAAGLRGDWPVSGLDGPPPVFECDAVEGTGSYSIAGSPWSGHRRFVYDLLGWWRPRRVVDLGVHWGCSTFAFAQAAKDFRLGCEIIGVDTFVGDEHAGRYGEEVYRFVRRCATEVYAGVRLQFRRGTFREALPTVADGSADLVHIDGCHEYEHVREDFETWLPKLAPHGLVLLHDTCPEHPYGSERLWRELAERYPALEFRHSWGLGLLFPKGARLYRAMLRARLPLWADWYVAEDRRRRQRMIARQAGASALGAEGNDPPGEVASAPQADALALWRYRERSRLVSSVARRWSATAQPRVLLLGAEPPEQLVELAAAFEKPRITVLGPVEKAGALGACLRHAFTAWVRQLGELPAGGFDMAVSLASLERRPQPSGFLRQVAERLRPGGVLLATSPSLFWCRLEAGRGGEPFCRPPPVVLGRGFGELCREQGLRVRESGRFMLAPRSALARRGMVRGASAMPWVDGALDRVPLLRLALVNRYFVATREPGPTSTASR